MSSNDAKTNLGAQMDAAKSAPTKPKRKVGKLPTPKGIGRISLFTKDKVEFTREQHALGLDDIKHNLGEFASALADEGDGMLMIQEIMAAADSVTSNIRKFEHEAARIKFTNALMTGAIESFPAHGLSLVVIRRFGDALNYFRTLERPKRGEPRDPRAIYLPQIIETKWVWSPVRVNFPDSHGPERDLREKAEVVSTKHRGDRRDALVAFKEGAAGPEHADDILEKGGEGWLWVADETFTPRPREGENPEDVKPITRPGGTIRYRVDGEKVYAVDAMGGCARRFKEAAAEGVFVPVSQILRHDSINPNIPHEQKKLARLLHGLVRRGLAQERKNQQGRDAITNIKERAVELACEMDGTSDPTEVLVDKNPGVCYVFDRQKQGLGILVECNADGEFRVVDALPGFEDLVEQFGEAKKPGQAFGNLGRPLSGLLNTVASSLRRARQQSADESSGTSEQDETKEAHPAS